MGRDVQVKELCSKLQLPRTELLRWLKKYEGEAPL